MRHILIALSCLLFLCGWSDVQISRDEMTDRETPYITSGTDGFQLVIGCETRKDSTRGFRVIINLTEYVGRNPESGITFRVGSKQAWLVPAKYSGDRIEIVSPNAFVEKLFTDAPNDSSVLFHVAVLHQNVSYRLSMAGAKDALDKLERRCGMTAKNRFKDWLGDNLRPL